MMMVFQAVPLSSATKIFSVLHLWQLTADKSLQIFGKFINLYTV